MLNQNLRNAYLAVAHVLKIVLQANNCQQNKIKEKTIRKLTCQLIHFIWLTNLKKKKRN